MPAMPAPTVTLPGYNFAEVLYEDLKTSIYRGTRSRDGKPVIVKALRATLPTLEDVARLRHEYDIARLLPADHVVPALDFFLQGNMPVLVLEDFGGIALHDVIPRQANPGEITTGTKTSGLPLDEFFPIAKQLVRALEALHQCGISHRDIKPRNILLNPQTGQVKLGDFGVASQLASESREAESAGALRGTLAYMSPEQTGRMNLPVDYRTDFYSLGVTFFEMLTGRLPFEASDPLELLHCHIARVPPVPHDINLSIPPSLSNIVLKLLAKTAHERYCSARGLEFDLDEIQRRWQKGEIEPFELGTQDCSSELQISHKLYGRENEVADLLAAFERAANHAGELVMVSGFSGIGKTSVVNEIHKPIVVRRGYFVSGKFDQFRRHVPYASLIQAFQQLIRQILTESEERLAQFRRQLQEVLGPNGQVIIEVIPEVELILGLQPPVPTLGPQEAQNRFNMAFQRFISVFADKAHPLALFLDDLQWADPASLRLLQALMADAGKQHLLIIGAYRDNEVSASHALRLALEEIRKSGVSVKEIAIGPLEISCAEQLLEDSLHCEAATAKPLAALLHQRTGGNPFFLNQLLHFLHDEKLLCFNHASGAWQWDLDEIQKAGLTDDVVELMAGKIQKLSKPTQEALKLAACVGGTFDSRTLALARGNSEQSVAAELWEAVREGLLRPLDDAHQLLKLNEQVLDGHNREVAASYRFLHDRVQQAALSMVPGDEQQRLHLHIGRMLLGTSNEAEEEQLFDIANHFNEALELIQDGNERAVVSRLNFEAGRKARSSAAHSAALKYFTIASELAPPTFWQDDYETAFHLTHQRAECAYLEGQFDLAEALFQEGLRQARTEVERASIEGVRIQLYITRGEYEAALKVGLQGLRRLGLTLPDNPTQLHMMRELLRTRSHLRGRRIEELENAPRLNDAHQEAALSLLSSVAAAAYLASQQTLFLILVLKSVSITLRYGNSIYTAPTFAFYGLMMGSGLGNYKSGVEWGRMALRFADATGDSSVRCITYFIFATYIDHWRHPIAQSEEFLWQAYRYGLEAGELVYSGYSVVSAILQRATQGLTLDEQKATIEEYSGFLRWTKEANQLAIVQLIKQACLNLQGQTASRHLLDSEEFEEERLLSTVWQENGTGRCAYYITKTRLCYLWGDYEAAHDMARRAGGMIEALMGQAWVVESLFFSSLTIAALYQQNREEQNEYRKQLKKNLKALRKWAVNSPENCGHKHLLIAAEMARIAGRDAEAITLYDQAIRSAQDNGFLQNEALANEVAARFFTASNRLSLARGYREQAHYLYGKWGASAKVAALEGEFPELGKVAAERTIAQRTAIDVHRTTDPLGGDKTSVLDLATVIKAAQAISGEIDLSRLLRQLLRYAMENAGATRGLLILERQGHLYLEAAGSIEDEEIALDSQPIENCREAPLSIVQYVARTRENVVLDDATNEGLFVSDSYILQQHPQSVLCAPILHQARLAGLIYLENNLAPAAFTPAHLEVLSVLSAQAAISLQNARLYRQLEDYSHTLEERVEERTEQLRSKNEELETALHELKEMQNRIVEQQKMASLGVLTAGIAHEIKNPLNFVNNFAALSLGLVNEINVEIAKVKEHLGEADCDYLDEILGDLQGNMTRINEHGKRADSIVRNMLMHSRGQTSQPESVNLNDIVHEAVQLAYHGQRARNASFNVTIEEDYAPDLPPVRVLPQEISRVILNIVGNACYAVQQKEEHNTLQGESEFLPKLRVTTDLLDDALEIRIEDNGAGIPAEVREKIFNPFFTTKPTGEGTGLGLSMSYDIIVQQHGGEISVESTPGQGTQFIITLPKKGIKTS